MPRSDNNQVIQDTPILVPEIAIETTPVIEEIVITPVIADDSEVVLQELEEQTLEETIKAFNVVPDSEYDTVGEVGDYTINIPVIDSEVVKPLLPTPIMTMKKNQNEQWMYTIELPIATPIQTEIVDIDSEEPEVFTEAIPELEIDSEMIILAGEAFIKIYDIFPKKIPGYLIQGSIDTLNAFRQAYFEHSDNVDRWKRFIRASCDWKQKELNDIVMEIYYNERNTYNATEKPYIDMINVDVEIGNILYTDANLEKVNYSDDAITYNQKVTRLNTVNRNIYNKIMSTINSDDYDANDYREALCTHLSNLTDTPELQFTSSTPILVTR